MDHLDLVHRHAQPVVHELGEGGFMPLAVAVRAGDDLHVCPSG